MARRNRARTADPPAADALPAATAAEAGAQSSASPADQPREVVIRAGHTHRGVVYDGEVRYLATPAEIDLLQRYGAIQED